MLLLPMILSLLTIGICAERVFAADTPQIVRTRQVVAEGKVFIPRIQGMSDSKTQELLNQKIKAYIVALKNDIPGSSLNGDFTVSFYNQKLLGVHFKGYSYTKGTAHPNKIDQGIHIDLTTGQIYQLADLFVSGVDFEKRIKELCTDHSERYRLQAEGLWNDWTNETFLGSWAGSDRAFLLSDKTFRVYSIPSYATGAIGGYNIPYEDLMDIIDTQGGLWGKIQSNPPSAVEVLPDNVVDRATVEVGDVYAGLKVAKLEF